MKEQGCAKKSTAEIVLEAVQDIHAREQIVTRETLAELTGLKLTTIDDRLGYLLDNGKIRRVQRGVFVPMEQHKPARLITRTLLPDGTTVLEIGDTVMQLTPRESRVLGELMAGSGQQYAAIQIGHEAEFMAATLSAKVRRLERLVQELTSAHAEEQMALPLLASNKA
ncbi:hypothetical protein [Thauera humireducens]|uniref:Uncharacterized protein n=1 Tax=Thauera humireducens TaxID=1134435 RepID=A0A127K393_9RHOO|nr:hypothetical protein [Thauera humireducens]AMO36425.1 hypothetical protein AC731_005430 [Thauera humireducens]AMO36628.1 hypothetical protein AC731_006535 [Thauera humireducens]